MVDHAQFFHQVPDDVLADMLPLAKKVAIAIGLEDGQYNLLQVKRKKKNILHKFLKKWNKIEQWTYGSSSKSKLYELSLVLK